jgi:hypothetical protein
MAPFALLPESEDLLVHLVERSRNRPRSERTMTAITRARRVPCSTAVAAFPSCGRCGGTPTQVAPSGSKDAVAHRVLDPHQVNSRRSQQLGVVAPLSHQVAQRWVTARLHQPPDPTPLRRFPTYQVGRPLGPGPSQTEHQVQFAHDRVPPRPWAGLHRRDSRPGERSINEARTHSLRPRYDRSRPPTGSC